MNFEDFQDLQHSEKVYLFKLEAAQASDPATTRTLTIGTADRAFTAYYEPAGKGVPRMLRSLKEIFDQSSTISWGDIILARTDGYEIHPDGITADDLVDGTWIIRDRDAEILFGGEDLPESEYQTIFSGKSKNLSWTDTEIRIRVADLQQVLAGKYVTPNIVDAATYGNAPAASLGKPLPLALGKCFNMAPILVDTVNHEYVWTDTSVVSAQSLDDVYLDGKSVSHTDMGFGKFRLSAAATGRITCDGQGAKFGSPAAFKDKAADIAAGLLQEFGDFSASDIDSTYISQCNTDVPYQLGLYVTKSQTVLQTIDDLISGMPVGYTFTRAGKFRIFELPDTSGTADYAISQDEIGNLSGEEEIKIVYSQAINYRRNYAPIDEANADGTLTATRKADLATEWKQARYADTSILTQYPLATQGAPMASAIVSQTDAESVAEKWVDLLGAYRRKYSCRIKTLSLDYELGKLVALTYQPLGDKYRFNLDGDKFVIIEIDEDYINNEVGLTLWG